MRSRLTPSRLLRRFDALSSRSAWILGIATGVGAVFATEDPRGLWALLLLPLLTVALTRRVGLRPSPERRVRGSVITSLGVSLALAGGVVALGQALTLVPVAARSDASWDDALLTELRLDLGIEPELGDGSRGSSSEAGSTGGADVDPDVATEDSGTPTSDAGDARADSDATDAADDPDYVRVDRPRRRKDPDPSEPDEPVRPPDDPPVVTDEPPEVRFTCPSDMVLIEGGALFDKTLRVEESRIEPFCLDRTEVTVSAYRRCLEAGKGREGGCKGGGQSVVLKNGGSQRDPTCNLTHSDRGNHPINCIDRAQAQAFCRWRGRGLPSNRRWEWAARHGADNHLYPWGDAPDPSCNVTVMNEGGRGCGRDATWPVGTMRADATPDGVKDMGGNVKEWTSSTVVRGGGWTSQGANRFRVTTKTPVSSNLRSAHVGFRCAAKAKPTEPRDDSGQR